MASTRNEERMKIYLGIDTDKVQILKQKGRPRKHPKENYGLAEEFKRKTIIVSNVDIHAMKMIARIKGITIKEVYAEAIEAYKKANRPANL